MWKKVRDYIDKYELLESGDRIIAAVSGGADSVCLLSVLCDYAKETKGSIRLRAVHVHHGLRGEEADRDEAFVRQLCGRLQVPLTVVHRRAAEYAAAHGLSVEEAGRVLRYEAFREAAEAWEAEENGPAGTGTPVAERAGGGTPVCGGQSAVRPAPVKVAVAHHQDDNAETVLYHLLRGSGLKGLAGIRPRQGDRIRPLLGVRREEILAYLREQKETWCEDSTNADCDYTRNRIRNQILPLLAETVNVRAVENILHAGEIFAQADDYLAAQAEIVWQQAGTVTEDGPAQPEIVTEGGPEQPEPRSVVSMAALRPGTVRSAQIRLADFLRQPEILRSYLIRRMLELAAPGQKNVTSRHYRQIEALAEGRTGGRCDLPGSLAAVRDYESLRIERTGPAAETATARQVKTVSARQLENAAEPAGSAGRTARFADLSMQDLQPDGPEIRVENLLIRVFSRKKTAEIPKNQYTKWFDYDKIKGTLSVRSRQTGDYLTLPGGGRKPVARYMIDEKIPKEVRDRILLLAEQDHVLWVIGYRISEYYKITNTTETILQVKADGGEEHGR